MLPRHCGYAVSLALLPAGGAFAQLTTSITTGPIGIGLEQIATFTGGPPLDLTHAGDGTDRLFIAGKENGVVRLYKNNALQSTPFLNIPGAGVPIMTANERGLLGIAFHPNFSAPSGTPGSGKFYTYTSEAKGTVDFNHPELGSTGGDHDSVIREWTVNPANPDVVDTSAASRVIMRIRQPQANHNAGALKFGPDGYLYIALGDGGGANDNSGGINAPGDGHTNGIGNAQDITNIYGSVARIDPLHPSLTTGSSNPISANGGYRVPQSNPFVGVSGVDEIYAYGLRNPWRMSFDRETGVLYAADVGQGQREEVNIILNGLNYGWVYMEGTRVNRTFSGSPSFEPPVGEYTHNDGNAVIGGYVYRGQNIPELYGKYVFGDYGGKTGSAGRLFFMEAAGGTIFEFQYFAGTSIGSRLYSVGEDRDGELYAMFQNGAVSRILGRQWFANGGGSWSTSANWLGGLPNGTGSTANFLGRLTTPANAPAIVTLDGSRTVGFLRFNNTVTNGVNPHSFIITPGTGGTLTLNNGATPGLVHVIRGTHAINVPIAVSGNTNITVNQDAAFNIGSIIFVVTGRTLTKSGPGPVVVSDHITLGSSSVLSVTDGTLTAKAIVGSGSLSISGGATVRVTPDGTSAGVTRVTSLNIAGGTLDLNDNDLIVDYSGASPYTTLLQHVLDGYRSAPDPSATGIVSSTSQNQGGDTILVLLDNAMLATPLSSWAGHSIDADTVIGKYTYFGDANLDGQVTGDDFALAVSNLGMTGAHWIHGDVNFSGAVTGDDIAIIVSNLGKGVGNPLGATNLSGTVVPEPSLLVWPIALATLARRRRR